MSGLEDMRIAMHARPEGFERYMKVLEFASRTPAEREKEVKSNWTWFREKGRG